MDEVDILKRELFEKERFYEDIIREKDRINFELEMF